MLDNRAKNIPEELIDALNAGTLKGILENVKNNNNLHLCFRGNSTPPSVIIYYNNHIVLRISYLRRGPHNDNFKIAVSANHSKSEEKRALLEELRNKYQFNIPKKLNEEDINRLSYPYCYISKNATLNSSFFKDLCNLMINVIDSFFGKNNKKVKYIEKKRQHELFTNLVEQADGYYAYDLEFSQKYVSQAAREAEGKQNHPDMLGIRYENGLPKALTLIEVKSTRAACKDKTTGLEIHISGMIDYLKSAHMKDRKQEAIDIIDLYKRLNIHQAPKSLPNSTQNIGYEIIVILTDGAIKYYEQEYVKKGKSLNNNKIRIYKWDNNTLCPCK